MTTWDESEHPRDDDGKFTYKNGGGGVIQGKLKKKKFKDEQTFYTHL